MDSWKNNKGIRDTVFVNNDKIIDRISNIQKVARSNKVIERITGHSGIGKTRCVFEALSRLKNIKTVTDNAIYQSVLYGRADINFQQLLTETTSIVEMGYRATIVVDDCNAEQHGKLAKLTEHIKNNINLITIDHAVSESSIEYYKLDTTVIEEIVQVNLPTASKELKEKIVALSDGYPERTDRFSSGGRQECNICQTTF